jgi:peptidoglycan/LPS O-acetylase OafA/YrhL
VVAALKRFEIKALYWIGFFSYEIYLFHWPLMYRYYSLFKILPPWLAMLLYLPIFIVLGWLMQKLIGAIGPKKS